MESHLFKPLIIAAVSFLTFNLSGFSKEQDLEDTALVDRFFPQSLIDESNEHLSAGGASHFRSSTFIRADLDQEGFARYVIAAYTNGLSGAVRVIRKENPSVIVAESSVPLMFGIYSSIRLVNFRGSGSPAIVVSFTSATGNCADWIYERDKNTLKLVGPAETLEDGNQTTVLGDAVFVDLRGDGKLEIVNPPDPLGAAADVSALSRFKIFELSGDSYVSTGRFFNFFETFVQQQDESEGDTRSFTLENSDRKYVLTVAKRSESSGTHRIASAEIWINGRLIVSSKNLPIVVQALTIPIELSSSNTISVKLNGPPGAELSVGIGPE